VSEWIPVGRLRRTRGNRGELLGEVYSSKPGRAESLKTVLLEADDRRRESTIERLWFHDGVPVFKFEGIDSISDAEPWEGADVLAPASERLALEEDEYTFADLIGCELFSGSERIGVVRDVQEVGGPPLLAVEAKDGREILVPFAKSICRDIDIARKVIRAELPEGLIDL
jgi:16S rRNA processing protein RimM